MIRKLFLFLFVFLLVFSAEARPRRFVNVHSGGAYAARNAAGEVALVPHWADGLSVGNFSNAAAWQELSGLATPQKAANSGDLWVISDSPQNMLAAINAADATSRGVYTLETPPTYVDWEDIEAATVSGQEYLYVFDYGNNGNGTNSRGTGVDMRIFRIQEPTINGSGGVIAAANRIEIEAVFPGVNGPTLRDAECSIVDPLDGKIYIIPKRNATQQVYSLAHSATYSGIQTLVYEGNMTAIPSKTTQPLTPTATYCVDAAISPDGTEILIKNYDATYLFPRNPATQTIIQALQQSLVEVPAYVGGGYGTTTATRRSHPNAEPQGEGIAFGRDGRDWYSNSEYLSSEGATAARYPLFKYTRASAAPTTVSFQTGVAPTAGYDGTLDTYIWDTNPATDNGSAASMVVDKAPSVETDQRKGLLKFDLSSIPTTATVVGCKLDLYCNTEGAGFNLYRVLPAGAWVESSTYNSLTTGINDDGTDASSTESARNAMNHATYTGFVRTNMLVSDCQAMVSDPANNYGWLIENTDTAGNGHQFDTSEGTTANRRPMLTLRYVN